MSTYAYARPGTLGEAYDLLDEGPGDVRMIVGGTDLIVGLQRGHITPRLVMDLKHIGELGGGITHAPGRVTISAVTSMSEIIADERVGALFPALVEAAKTVGSIQIRNRASLTGNICNASPAADTAPALLAYDAVAVLSSRAGERRTPVGDFLLGPRRTDVRPGEIVTALELPEPTGRSGATIARLTRRRGVDLATLSLCCVVGTTRARFAFGAVAPTPFLVDDDSGVLADVHADADDRERLLREVTARARPISDLRAGADYRQAMLLVLSRRALRDAIALRDNQPIVPKEPDA
jgi:CO/xanthine dehydrogenase FAD-binding subunit